MSDTFMTLTRFEVEELVKALDAKAHSNMYGSANITWKAARRVEQFVGYNQNGHLRHGLLLSRPRLVRRAPMGSST